MDECDSRTRGDDYFSDFPVPHLSVDLDVHRESGPSGTVLLSTKSIKAASIHGLTADLGNNRYWVDPSRNYLSDAPGSARP